MLIHLLVDKMTINFNGIEITKEDVILMNNEISNLREELFNSYLEVLTKYYGSEIALSAKPYYIFMPNYNIKGRSQLEVLLECCRVAKFNSDERKKDL